MAAVGRGGGLLRSRVDRQKALRQRKEQPRCLPQVQACAGRQAHGRPARGSARTRSWQKAPLSRTRWQLLLCGLAELGNQGWLARPGC